MASRRTRRRPVQVGPLLEFVSQVIDHLLIYDDKAGGGYPEKITYVRRTYTEPCNNCREVITWHEWRPFRNSRPRWKRRFMLCASCGYKMSRWKVLH